MITVTSLAKSFTNHHLFSSLSFYLDKGLLSIEGKSGSGKSTLLSIIMGKQKPDSGSVLYDKSNLVFSYCGQEASLIPQLSLKQNLKIFNCEINYPILKKLENGLNYHDFDNSILYLSGGERQKAEIIACLSKKADVYCLDESFSSIDKESKAFLVSFLNWFSKSSAIILINHDETLTSLTKKTVINLNDGKAIIQSGEISNKTYGKSNKPYQSNSFWPAIKSYFKSNKFYSLIKTLFSTVSLVFLALGIAYSSVDSTFQLNKRLIEADPFNAHPIQVNNMSSTPDSSFFETLNNHGIEYLELSTGSNRLNLDGVLNKKDQIEYHSTKDSKDNLITQEQNVTLDSKTYNLSFISKQQFSSAFPFDTLQWKSIQDSYTKKECLLCNQGFIDELIKDMPSSLSFEKDIPKFYGWLYYSYDSATNQIDGSTISLIDSTANIIETDNPYYLSIPSKSIGDIVYDNNGISYRITNQDTDGRIHFGIDLFKFLEMHSFKTSADSWMGYFISDDCLFSLMKKYSGEITAFDISYERPILSSNIYFYLLSIIFLLADMFFVFFSKKGKEKWFTSLKSVYQNQNISASSLKIGLLISNIIEEIPALTLSILLYFFVFLPKANFDTMVFFFSKNREGYYYYSQEPLNNYYDSLLKPISIYNFNYPFFLIILAFIILSLTHYLSLISANSKKNKN